MWLTVFAFYFIYFQYYLEVAKQRALGPRGEPVVLLRSEDWKNPSISISCLITLDPANPVFITGVENRGNTQYDFLDFIKLAIANGYLVRGDYLILDNATVHLGNDIYGELLTVLKNAGVQIRYLPTYSPELNPAELVFANVKRWIREYANPSWPLWKKIVVSFSLIDNELLKKLYNKSLSGHYFRCHYLLLLLLLNTILPFSFFSHFY